MRSNRFSPPRLIGVFLLAFVLLAGCQSDTWNNPYPKSDAEANSQYRRFKERPKHLDPVSSYSEEEARLIDQIYEPPLQYHYLKRPYELMPRGAAQMPTARYLDADGNVLPADAPGDAVAFTEYDIQIRDDARYQPHPAFAKDAGGEHRYHALTLEQSTGIYSPNDLPETGSRAVRAEDYVYQLKRMARPGVHSPLFGFMSEYIVGLREFNERLTPIYEERKAAGAHPFLDLRQYELSGVQVLDEHNYRIRIHGKYPQFVYWLAMTFFSPVPWEVDAFYSQPGLEERNVTLDWFPVGSGPYMMVENNPNRRIVLARNPNFHGEAYPSEGAPGDEEKGLLADAGKPLPFIDKLIYIREQETIPYWNKFLQGYYDVATQDEVSSDSFDQAISISVSGDVSETPEMAERGVSLALTASSSVWYWGFNMLDPVVGGYTERGRKLRQAISIALNFEEYISIFENGLGIPAHSPIPPGIAGYKEGQEGVNPYVYNWTANGAKRKSLEEAKQLMVEAGYPNGRDVDTGKQLAINFDIPASGPGVKAMLDWMRKQFASIGIQLDIRDTDYNRFQEKVRKGTVQFFRWGWNADYPDPENFMFLLYGPNGRAKYEGENAANYESPEFDALFEKMKNMDPGPERAVLIEEMVEILRRDAPWAFGYYPMKYVLHHDWYGNVKPNLMARNFFKYLKLDPQRRAEKRTEWNRPVRWPLIVLALLLLAVIVPAWTAHRRHERASARDAASRIAKAAKRN